MSLDILQYRRENDPNDSSKKLPKVTASAVEPSPLPSLMPSGEGLPNAGQSVPDTSLIGATENPILDMLEQVPDAPPPELPQSVPVSGQINPYSGDINQMSLGDIQRLGMPDMIPSAPKPEAPTTLGLPDSGYAQVGQQAQDNYEREKYGQELIAGQEFENPQPFYVYPDPTVNPNPIVHKTAEEWFNEGRPTSPEDFFNQSQTPENNPFAHPAYSPYSSSVTANAIEKSGGMLTETGKGFTLDEQFSWEQLRTELVATAKSLRPIYWLDSAQELLKGNWQGALKKAPVLPIFQGLGGAGGSYGKGAAGNIIRYMDFVDNATRGLAADALKLKRIGEKGDTGESHFLRATIGGKDYSAFQTREVGSSPFAMIPENFSWKNPAHWARGAGGFLADMALGIVTGAVVTKPIKAGTRAILESAGILTAKGARTKALTSLSPRVTEALSSVKPRQPLLRTVPKTPEEILKAATWKAKFDADLAARRAATTVPGKVSAPIPINQPKLSAVKVQPQPKSIVIGAPTNVPIGRAPYDVSIPTEPYPTVLKPLKPDVTPSVVDVNRRVLKEAADRGVVTVDTSGNIIDPTGVADTFSPVLKPSELVPQPTVTEALESIRTSNKNSLSYIDDITSVRRSNQDLTDLATFLGHVEPRSTPLQSYQIKVLEEQYGSLYSRYGRAVDGDKLKHPMLRVEVQAANAADGTPQVTRLVSTRDLAPSGTRAFDSVLESQSLRSSSSGTRLRLRSSSGSPLSDIANLFSKKSKAIQAAANNPEAINSLPPINEKLVNLPRVDYGNPVIQKELRDELPSNMFANSPDALQRVGRSAEIEEKIGEVVDELEALSREQEGLIANLEVDEPIRMKYSQSVPDDLEETLEYSREVWNMDDAVTPDYVPYRVAPPSVDDLDYGMVDNAINQFDWYHGTRVDPSDELHYMINPDNTKNFHELGTGVYFTSDVEKAGYYAKAQPSQNLPDGVPISDTAYVHTVTPTIKGKVLMTNLKPTDEVKGVFRGAAERAGTPADVLQSYNRKLGQAQDTNKAWEAFYDTYIDTVGSPDPKLFHKFQVEAANGLRNGGYEAILRVEKGGGEATLNVLGRGGMEMPFNIRRTTPVGTPSVMDSLAARASVEKARGASRIGKFTQARAREQLASQARHVAEQRVDNAANRLEALMEEQQQTMEALEKAAKREKNLDMEIKARDTGDVTDPANIKHPQYYDDSFFQDPCL